VEQGDLPRLRDLRVVGQIASGYILVDEPLAAWVVDQHAAHGVPSSTGSPTPKMGGCPPYSRYWSPRWSAAAQDAAEAADSLEELSVYGFEVEPFGKDSFRINRVIST
jgi:DNA mismatch repair ATPase MutL